MSENFFGKKRCFFVLGLTGMALLAVLYWIIRMKTLSATFSYGDEGFVAEAARRIYRGEVPYRDFFNGVTPGAFYFYALLFKLLGPSFFTLRLGVLLTAGMVFIAVWWLLYRLEMRRAIPFVMAAVYLPHYGATSWFIASYHWLVVALCLFSLGLLLSDENDTNRYWKVAAGGVLATLAAFTMQHKGVLWMLAATVALLAFPVGQRKRALLWFWGGILTAALPLVITFVVVVGWDTLVADLIVFPLSQYHNVEGHRGTLIDSMVANWKGVQSAWLYRDKLVDWVRIFAWNTGFVGEIVVYLFPFLGAAALVSLWRGEEVPKQKLALLAAFLVASYIGTLYRLTDSTFIFAAPSSVLVVIFFLHIRENEVASPLSLRLKRWAVWTWLVLFGTVSISYGVVSALSQKVTTQTPAGPVDSYLAGEAQTVEGVMAYMRAYRQPDEKVFCYPYAAIYYFLLQTENPTPYDLLTYPINTQDQLDHAQDLLDADQTRWVIWSNNYLENNSFNEYLRRNYEIKARFKYVNVLERRQNR